MTAGIFVVRTSKMRKVPHPVLHCDVMIPAAPAFSRIWMSESVADARTLEPDVPILFDPLAQRLETVEGFLCRELLPDLVRPSGGLAGREENKRPLHRGKPGDRTPRNRARPG